MNIAYANGQVAAELSEAECGKSNNRSNSSDSKIKVANNVSFVPRSVEGIYVYLGQMARTELGLNGKAAMELPDPSRQCGSPVPRRRSCPGPRLSVQAGPAFCVRSTSAPTSMAPPTLSLSIRAGLMLPAK